MVGRAVPDEDVDGTRSEALSRGSFTDGVHLAREHRPGVVVDPAGRKPARAGQHVGPDLSPERRAARKGLQSIDEPIERGVLIPEDNFRVPALAREYDRSAGQ